MPEERAILRLHEYERSPEPIRLRPAVARAIRDHLGAYLEITPELGEAGVYWLKSRQFVGDLVVDDLRIRISSAKAPMENLFWMLSYAEGLMDFREEEAGFTEDEGIFEYLARMFARQVEQLLRGGLYRAYHEQRGARNHFRGRLDLPRQLRHGIVHPERLHLHWSEHSPDVLENQLLRRVVLMLAGSRFSSDVRLGLRFRRLDALLDGVSLRSADEHAFRAIRYNQLNRHYQQPLALARVLHRYMHVRNERGAVPFATYLIDLNALFERFIAAYLREALAGTGIAVRDQQLLWLDADRREDAYVDVVLFRGGRPILALDTKFKTYKGRPARADLYQMFAYCHALDVPCGVLLYPRTGELRERRLLRGATVEMRGVWLGGPTENLRRHLNRVADDVAALAGGVGVGAAQASFAS